MNVLILGLGQYPKGSGIAAALFFARRGDAVTVYDFYYASAMDKNIAQLKKFKNVRFVLGKRALNEIAKADLIVKHQRIRMDEPEVVEALRLKKTIESELSIFLNHCPAQVIGITGTRGKSTTTAFIAEMLRVGAGLVPALRADGAGIRPAPTKSNIWLGGNILVSPLTFLSKVKKDDIVVLEISSFQSEGLGMAKISPHIAVWTNLMRDHLNAYPSMREYANAKAQIFLHQTPEDIAFFPMDHAFDAYAKRAKGKVYRFGHAQNPEVKLVRSVKLTLMGEHNQRNAEIAAAVALHLRVSSAAIKRVLRSFGGLSGRLEILAVKKGIRYINDTTATTPDATMAAVNALSSLKGNIHLIFGGADKELAFDDVARLLKKKKIDVVLLAGTAHKKISTSFAKAKLVYREAKDMKEAFTLARAQAKSGDVVLLSPGCASFGLFKNEYDRGEAFKKLVDV